MAWETTSTVDVKTNFAYGGFLCIRSGAAEFDWQQKKFRQTQQLESESDECDWDDVVCEERHVVSDEYAAVDKQTQTDQRWK